MTKEELKKYFIINFKDSDEKIIKIIGKSVLKEICFDPYILDEKERQKVLDSFKKEFGDNGYSEIEERYIRKLMYDVELGNVQLNDSTVKSAIEDVLDGVKSISK